MIETFFYRELEDGTYEIGINEGAILSDTLTVPDSYMGKAVTRIADHGFLYGNGIVLLTIPASITHIGKEALAIGSLESITFESGSRLTHIGERAFAFCSVRAITLPASLQSIGGFAFSTCEQLESITLPASLSAIGEGAFASCPRLASITLDGANDSFLLEGGALYTKDGKTLVYYAVGRPDTSFTAKSGVTHIAPYAFSWSHNLQTIVLPEGVTHIGEGALALWLRGIDNLYLPSTLLEIAAENFPNAPGAVTYNGTREAFEQKVALGTGNDAFFMGNLIFTEK